MSDKAKNHPSGATTTSCQLQLSSSQVMLNVTVRENLTQFQQAAVTDTGGTIMAMTIAGL